MRLFNLHIVTDKKLQAIVDLTWQKAEAATVEICALHLENIRNNSVSETARRVLEVSAQSLRKLTNIKNG